MLRALVALVLLLSASSAAASSHSRATGWRLWNWLRGDGYALDGIERFIDDPKQRVACHPEEMIAYRGTNVRYAGSLRVSEPFRQRLERFEQLLADVSVEIYGRVPRRIRHYGAYSCRPSRNRAYRLSEHALGNAVDIVGFDFGASAKEEVLPPGVPKSLRYPFEVRVARHWAIGRSEVAALHSRFLRLLTARLTSRRDIFRCLFGPSHRGHHDHFHFDMSPWRYVHL